MSKIIDITNKLNFEEKPCIQIKGTVLAVNNDAPSMMKVMAILEDGTGKASDVRQLVDLLFDAPEHEKLDALKLPFPDYAKVIMQAAEFAAGGTIDAKGETETPATT